MKKISVIGAGSLGTTFAILLDDKGYDVTLWIHDKKKYNNLIKTHENNYYLPDIKLSASIKLANDINTNLLNADFIVLAIPTQHLRTTIKKISKYIKPNSIIINVSKGIENNTHKLATEVITDELAGKLHKNITVLSGPSCNKDLILKKSTIFVAAGFDTKNVKLVKDVFTTNFTKVYMSQDLRGVQIGGAIKNSISIIAGIIDGMGIGNSIKAAIITRAYKEMILLGKKFGADENTFQGLTGLGEILLSYGSQNSVNRKFGFEIGRGKDALKIVKESNFVIEGVATLRSIHEISNALVLNLHLFESLYQIIFENKKCHYLIERYMNVNFGFEY